VKKFSRKTFSEQLSSPTPQAGAGEGASLPDPFQTSQPHGQPSSSSPKPPGGHVQPGRKGYPTTFPYRFLYEKYRRISASSRQGKFFKTNFTRIDDQETS